jgi:Protein of unknown function (DUF5132)
MAILEDEQRTLVIGMVAGVAAAGLTKFLVPAFSDVGRPVLKAMIKTGLIAYERGREALAHAGETFEDLLAESRAEIERELTPPRPAQATPATSKETNGGR